MGAWWHGLRLRHRIAIVACAAALALLAILWLDARGAGDPRLCGHSLFGAEPQAFTAGVA